MLISWILNSFKAKEIMSLYSCYKTKMNQFNILPRYFPTGPKTVNLYAIYANIFQISRALNINTNCDKRAKHMFLDRPIFWLIDYFINLFWIKIFDIKSHTPNFVFLQIFLWFHIIHIIGIYWHYRFYWLDIIHNIDNIGIIEYSNFMFFVYTS